MHYGGSQPDADIIDFGLAPAMPEFCERENGELAGGILFLACIQLEILVLRSERPPSWFSSFRLHLSVSVSVPFERLAPENGMSC